MLKFNVIIPTFKNDLKQNSLYFTLRSILAQTVLPNEIFVVDNDGSTSERKKLQDNFGDTIYILDGSKKRMNISYARNLAAYRSECDFLLFIDDDIVLGSINIFELLAKQMQYLDFYCGANRYWSKLHWHDQINKEYSIYHILNILKSTSFLPYSIDRDSGKTSYHHRSFIGNFGCINLKVFKELGGFDENFESWTYQDTDLMMRLANANKEYQLMANDGINIYHLSHGVEKHESRIRNKALFERKKKKLGINFHLNHFFGDFDSNFYSIISFL